MKSMRIICLFCAVLCLAANVVVAQTGTRSVSTLYNAIKSETDPDRMAGMFRDMEKLVAEGNQPNGQGLLDASRGSVVTAYAEKGDVENVRYWLWTFSEGESRDNAALAAVRTLMDADRLAEAEDLLLPLMKEREPRGASTQYGILLYKKGQFAEALPYLAPPSEEQGGRSGGGRGSGDFYALALIYAGELERANEEVNRLLSRPGFKSEELLAGIRKLYRDLYGNETRYRALVDSMTRAEDVRMREKVSKMAVNEPAPDFEIRDVHGNLVSLKSLRGKTVILDFWATWCVPCVASFPGMQRAVEHYKDDPSVVFMFIHTSERSDNPTEEAVRLLESKSYDFDLYMDLRDTETNRHPLQSAFGVRALPTKFLIDKEGIIRFKHAGYAADLETVAEIKTMVDMAKGTAGE